MNPTEQNILIEKIRKPTFPKYDQTEFARGFNAGLLHAVNVIIGLHGKTDPFCESCVFKMTCKDDVEKCKVDTSKQTILKDAVKPEAEP